MTEPVALHQLIQELPPRKRALLAARNPLSFAQERLWFVDQFAPGNPAYNIPFALRLDGDLDLQVLRLAVREVLHRHDALRTTFAAPDGKPMQVVHPPAGDAMPLIDLTSLPEGAQEAGADRLVRQETATPFDLTRGPLLRTTLLRRGARDHVLCGAMHHIVSDGWSLEVLIREVSTLYSAFLAGEPSPLSELPIQYLDYAQWQREQLRGLALREHLDYWRQALDGAPPVHELPTDRPRPKARSQRGASCSLSISPDVADGLRRAGRQANTTLFASLLGVFLALLGRVSDREDVVVGSPIAGRTREEFEPLIGFFVNMLVLRGDLSGNPRFSELLARVREVVVGAQAHQDLPFEKLVEELQPERNLSYSPLFQIAFVLLVPPREELELPGLRLRRMKEEAATSMFDLRLLCVEAGGRIGARLEYSSDLFGAATIDRFLRQFQALAGAAAALPERRLWELPLLDESERREVLALVEEGRRETSATACLHDVFAEQAVLRPAATAVTFEGGSLSYGELDRKANRLAHRLRALGVGPEVRVALCLERTLDLVVGVLAVLKAGGAYVPLDPAYPAERLAFLLEDSRARVLVTLADLAAPLPASSQERVLLDREDFAAWSDRQPMSGVQPENAAYVIYTSGSTGRPKGVVVTHANVIRLFAAAQDDFRFDTGDVWTLFHSYAFDFSVWEIWGALLYGGRLVVVSYWTSRSPERFHALLCDEKVTVLNQTPSAFLQLSQAEESGEARGELSLRWIVFGGEALDFQCLAPWFVRHGDARPRLVNMYGITETTVHVTFRPLLAQDAGQPASVIGPPLADLRLYVLDRGRELSPLGAPGEIFVAGPGLARGYLGSPALTADRFVPDPFGAPGGRLYKTGDLACRLADGEIGYLGRTDDQVKIRGFRIEIGEVQAALTLHPGVAAGVVLALKGESGGAHLVAWWVPNGEAVPSAGGLRDFLQGRLPGHMVPAAFFRLDRLPLTANGKLDRAALAAASETPAKDVADVAPRTPLEEVLATVWEQVLRVERAGIHDNFFALGGDSIRSVQVVALARERGIELTVQDLFEHQTVAELASGLGERGGAASLPGERDPFSLISAADRARLPVDVEDAYPLTRLQAGMLYHMALDPEAPLYHNVVSWHLAGPFEAVALQLAVDRAVARHAVLRTSFDLASPDGPVQRVHREALLPVEVEDLTALPPDEQEREIDAYLRSERGRPFDLTCPPMLRLRVHRKSEERFQLTLTENHAIFDGWSLHSTLAEIFRTYFARLQGAELAPEAPPAFAFGDYVALERAALEAEETRAYWLGRMTDAPFSALPRWPSAGVPILGDREVGPGVGGVALVLPPAVQKGIRALARTSVVPLKSVLLAAHARVVGLVCGQGDIVTGLVGHGRPESAGGTEVRGLFLNTLPLRLDLSRGSWQDLIRAVFAAEWEILPHRRYPLAALQEDLGGRQLFETGFNYIHFHVVDDVVSSSGLKVLGMKRSEGNNFALMANFSQTPGTGEVVLGLEYSARALTPAQAEAIAGYYRSAFEAMVLYPSAQQATVDLLSAPERQQILVEWNDVAVPVPEHATLTGLFATQVERQPEATAVVHEGVELTYRVLLDRVRRLAHHLRQIGVGPETLVGLHTERTPEMLVGLWGILEAGGAYLPLDPALPQERLAWMLEDSRAPVVLTQKRLHGKLPAWGGIALCLDGEELTGSAPGNLPLAGDDPHRLAYVLYTSGSTGRPKGVPITHRNVVNFLGFMGPRLGITEDDTLLAITTLSFDISVLELILPLVRGARIALVGPEVSTDGERLAEAIARHGATVMQATPATWQLLLQSGWLGRDDFRILCGGEALPGDLALPLLERGREVWNLYGPTETTIWSAVHRVVPEMGVAPLGRPISNTSLHVLDCAFRNHPAGVPGELFIGGAGLSRGYLNRSELTAEKFVPDPFAGESGARLYRTGDRVRRRPDGVLEFLGRTDQQVKLRGFRIELGEIEAVLREHPAVQEAAVALHEDRAGDRRLVGYVVAGPFVPFELPGQLRAHLQKRLPAYMSLSAVVLLDAMPQTPNGKLNRRALPAPVDSAFGTDEGYLAPRTPLEERVAGIWAELLGLERVGVESSFFELGGHSLLATRLIYRLAFDFQVSLRLPQLFAAPTVAGLAAAIARCKAEGAAAGGGLLFPQLSTIVPDPENRFEPFPLNDVQQAYWVGRGADFALGNVSSHNYTEMELAHLDVAQLEIALRRLIDRHDMLRAVVLADGRQQVLSEVPPYVVQVQDLRGTEPARAGAALEEVRAVMSHQVLPADRWPLFEVRASLLDGGKARLHFSLDYLVADAWSMRIIFREIFRFYREPELMLPPLELSFRDCVLAEKALGATDVYERAERYWQERLPSLPPAPELPLACDPRELGTPHFVRRLALLPAERWSRIKSAAARAGLTPSGVLLAAFAEVLGVWSKSPRFTVNVTLFNRPPLHPQIDEVVGDFTTLSLLAVDISRGDTFALRARGVQEQLWSDMEHRAVSAVRVLRDLARTQGRAPDSIMPVVFTSALGQGEARPDAEAPRASEAGDETSYGISQTPQVWLDHQVVETHGMLIYNWDAVEELFPPRCLDEMFAAFRNLLEELAAREEWNEIPRPPAPAAHLEIQRTANNTAGPVPSELLHDRFALQAAVQPERPAVIAPFLTLTYGELERRSNQLARHLRKLGVRPNQLVAVVMEKGWEQVVAVLAVLKAGAAYLPIDAGLPEKRLQHLLEQGEVRVALTQPSAAGSVAWPANLERIVVAGEPAVEISDAPLEPDQRLVDLAYVIFTSGSTGLPKGVMIDHRGAINTVLDVNERFAVGPEDRVLALSALNFDLSVWDVFGVLSAGGAIVFPDPADLRDPIAWAALIERHGVTIWNTVPALLEMLVEGSPPEARLDSLRLALLSGDWIPVTLPDRFRARTAGARVISMGGATEASIWSILYPIEEVDSAWPSIPYGRAMRNQTFHVLDQALDPRPLGVPGELYIGGVGVALGYWRDEEKTAARFLRHPRTGERLYRTGDLGRFLPDGNIEFLGREDFQIKIRGHRIELGEIEAALHQVEHVRSAVVNAVGEERFSRRLVAYVVLDRPAAELEPAPVAAPATTPVAAVRPAAAARPGVLRSSDGDLPSFEPIKGEIAKLEFKLAEHGLRPDEGRPGVSLAGPPLDEAFLRPYRERRTHREFLQQPVPVDRLHRVLSALADTGAGEGAKRRYLSPGGAYPVEIHVQVRPRGVKGLEAGAYRYDPVSNRLTLTTPGADIEPRWYEPVNQPVARQAAFGIFLIGLPDALRAAYGKAAREWSLLEAGSLGQLLMEVGAAQGIGFCPIGGISFEEARGLFGVDPSCVLLHSFLGGPIAREEREAASRRDFPRPAYVAAPFLEERISAAVFERFLAALRQVHLPDLPVAKYRYASAGALYPVQAYVAVAPGGVEGVEAGSYYYHPRDHRLVRLTAGVEGMPELSAANQARLPGNPAFSLVLAGRLGAIAPLYGEAARDFCLLEAGYMSQLLASVGGEMGVGFAPAACPDFWDLHDSFALDRDHVPLIAGVGGPIPIDCGAAGVEPSAAGLRHLDMPAEAERIHGRLAEVLPDYMIPSQIVFLTELPLTANGKVDRQSLPAPGESGDEGRTETRVSSVAPRSEMERTLAKVWSEVLGRERLGVHDNFFELGGTSLHMIRMRNRLQEELGRSLQITDFFKFPSVASLAHELSRSHEERDEASEGLALEEIDERTQKQKSALQRQKMVAQRRMKAHE